MCEQLKNNFFQAAFGSFIWVTFLSSLGNLHATIPFIFTWHLVGISILLGLVFGIVYPYLWNYSTFKAATNILLCTLINTICGFICIYLYSSEMFHLVKPYWTGVLVLTLVLHTICFYFYSRYDSKKLAVELNRLK